MKQKIKEISKELKLWNKLQGTNGLSGPEEVNKCIGNISIPSLYLILPGKKKVTDSAVILLCGGGYGVLCIEDEANPTANWLLKNGITVFVLKYRLPNGNYIIPETDARRAIRLVRHNARKWNINPNKIGVWGFSAGGHLASTVATVFDNGNPRSPDIIEQVSSRPDFVILFYPVISLEDNITNKMTKKNLLGNENKNIRLTKRYSNENNVNKDTPPTFLLHCSDDLEVPVENSLVFYKKLIENKISAEMLLFEKGGHGPDAFLKNPSWKPALKKWLSNHNWL